MQASLASVHSAHEAVQEFLALNPAELKVNNYEEYYSLVHQSGLSRAVTFIVLNHPETKVLDQGQGIFCLNLRARLVSVNASTIHSGEGHTRISCVRQPRLFTRKEQYQLYFNMGQYGDIGVHNGVETEEYSESLNPESRTPAATENLNSILRLSRVCLKNFAELTVVRV